MRQRAQPSPRGYSANGLGRAQLPCVSYGAWPGASVRAWCSVPDVGTGKALKGVTAARAPGHCHHQCWDAGALPWSSSGGPGACALMLAKLT